MRPLEYDDLRGFIEASKTATEWREIRGASWDLEIGALLEATAELVSQPPLLLFNAIPGYPDGFRVVALMLASYKRVAIALGFPTEISKLELIRLAARKVKTATSIPPRVVKGGPVMENVATGEEVDLFKFPVPRSHEGDGGRYIGTGTS